MANRASLIRSENSGKAVTRRGRRFLEFDEGNGQRRFIATIEPLHFGVNADQEIDTTWAPAVAPWNHQITNADYRLRALAGFANGQIIEYTDPSGAVITFQPMALNWVNNLTDALQQISMPQSVNAQADDASLYWANAYGSGRHFRYTAHPTKLIKEVILDSAASLPAPSVANPYLEVSFILDYSGATLYVNDAAWDRTTKTTTASRLEFRLASGKVAFVLDSPSARDAEGNSIRGIFQLRRSGNSRYVTIRFAKAWLDTAVYPVILDPTLTTPQDSTVSDTYIDAGNATTNYGTDQYDLKFGMDGGNICRVLMEFDLSSIPSGASISSADLFLYFGYLDPGGMSRASSIYPLLSGRSGWTETGATWNTYDGSNNWGTAGAENTSSDRSATAMGTFSTPSTYPDTLDVALNTTIIAGWCGSSNSNYGLLIQQDSNDGWTKSAATPSDNSTAANRPYLTVVYTTSTNEDGDALLSSSASVTAGASKMVSGAGSPSAQAQINASVGIVRQAVASLPASASLAATAVRLVEGASSLTGAGSTSGAGSIEKNGIAQIAATGTITATGETIIPGGEATLSASGTLTADGSVLRGASASVSGSSETTGSSSVARGAGSLLSGSSSVSLAGVLTLAGASSLATVGTLTADGIVSGQGDGIASLAGVASLTAGAVLIKGGSSALVVTASLDALASRLALAGSSLSGSAVLVSAPSRAASGLAELLSRSSLTASALSGVVYFAHGERRLLKAQSGRTQKAASRSTIYPDD